MSHFFLLFQEIKFGGESLGKRPKLFVTKEPVCIVPSLALPAGD